MTNSHELIRFVGRRKEVCLKEERRNRHWSIIIEQAFSFCLWKCHESQYQNQADALSQVISRTARKFYSIWKVIPLTSLRNKTFEKEFYGGKKGRRFNRRKKERKKNLSIANKATPISKEVAARPVLEGIIGAQRPNMSTKRWWFKR